MPDSAEVSSVKMINITHQAIDLISRELDPAKKIMEEIAHGRKSIIESAGESCVYDCELPLRYGLPCKCWLYSCVANSIPIAISLIHPRWFIDGPLFVISWRMPLDYGLSFEQMRCLAEGIQDNIHQKLREEEDMQVEVERMEQVKIEAKSGNRFRRGGVDLLHSAAYEAIDFHKSIADTHRGEEYARDYTRVMEKLNKKWEEKELARPSLPTTFPDEIRPNEILVTKKEEGDDGLTQAAKQLKPTRLSNAELEEKTPLNKEEDRGVVG